MYQNVSYDTREYTIHDMTHAMQEHVVHLGFLKKKIQLVCKN